MASSCCTVYQEVIESPVRLMPSRPPHYRGEMGREGLSSLSKATQLEAGTRGFEPIIGAACHWDLGQVPCNLTPLPHRLSPVPPTHAFS